MKGTLSVFAAAVFIAQCAAADCGETLCQVTGGGYAIALPEGVPRPGVFVYLHGYAATAHGAVGHAPLREPTLAHGMAFLAPMGQVDELQGKNLDWGVADGTDWARDDIDYIPRVIEDAVTRFGLDPDRVVLAGYSRGGSMVWDLACARPETAIAFASYAGAFWEPMPQSCAGPVHLWHSHGFADRTVPIEGQRIEWHGHPFVMGDVHKALGVWRRTMDCPDKADSNNTAGEPWLKVWTTCKDGSMTYALHPGGHRRPKDWVGGILDWVDRLSE